MFCGWDNQLGLVSTHFNAFLTSMLGCNQFKIHKSSQILDALHLQSFRSSLQSNGAYAPTIILHIKGGKVWRRHSCSLVQQGI